MSPKKKKAPKKDPTDVPKSYEALAKLTESDVIQQVKAGLSRLAPIEDEKDSKDTEDAPQVDY